MDYLDYLKASSKKFNSIVCMGMDPILEEIPISGNNGDVIKKFYEKILDKMVAKNIFPAAVKPNYAFYAQYGIEGIEALKYLIKIYKEKNIPVILDFKRGDIGKTAKAYANEAFHFFDADAVTLSPYLGYDSIEPFISNFPDKGYYVLTKTSNKSSSEIQDILYKEKPFFIFMAQKLIDWYSPGIGSVVGATFPKQLDEISDVFLNSKQEIPLLIPGIGSQGGDLDATINILKKYPDITIHRINSSSAINYAYKKQPNLSFEEAAISALKKLNNEINSIIDK